MGIVGAGAFVTCPVFVSEIAEDKYIHLRNVL